MKGALIIVLLLISYSLYATTAGNSNPAENIFSILPENVNYLRYYNILNMFDSSMVSYIFGEVQILTESNSQKVNLSNTLNQYENRSTFGSSSTGVSLDLQTIASTENFIIPNEINSQIKFFRLIKESGHPCNQNNPDPGGGHGEWDIIDRTEFVLELVDFNNKEVVAILDSVVSMPNSDPLEDSLHGTNPDLVFHTWLIPPNLYGDTCFLRVSPRRYGTTPLGLLLKETTSWVNYAAILDDYGNNMGLEYQNYLDSLCWIELQTYLNGYILVNQYLPKHNYFIPPQYLNNYTQQYLSGYDYIISNGDTIYHVTVEGGPQNTKPTQVKSEKSNSFRIKVVPTPIRDNNATLEIESPLTTYAVVKLISNTDGIQTIIWEGTVMQGINSVNIDLSKMISGSYSLNLIDKNNRHVFMGQKVNIIK